MRVPSLDLGRAHKDTYGLLVEMGPHYLTQAIHLSLVPSSTSHLTLFLSMFTYMFQFWLSVSNRISQATQGTHLTPMSHRMFIWLSVS